MRLQLALCTSARPIAAGLFEFLYTKKLNVCDDQQSNGDDGSRQDVLPEVPRCRVCNTLRRQIFGTGDPVNNKQTTQS